MSSRLLVGEAGEPTDQRSPAADRQDRHVRWWLRAVWGAWIMAEAARRLHPFQQAGQHPQCCPLRGRIALVGALDPWFQIALDFLDGEAHVWKDEREHRFHRRQRG